ncbi:1898_t:CDS:2 [Dentiscutata erythropus]|uniref:1898_t:CDS:1 n=1 Tax=Dentiscutata erythropus TaxID=1348616 RepID=A0A9N9HPE0_9GLOM|nr:1898_t:CDS:2 [Dentiscutata erythropus]
MSTGTCVEDNTYNYCNKLSEEVLLHSWIKIEDLWNELPRVDELFAKPLMRQTTTYNRKNHYDLEWAELVMRKFLTDYEDTDKNLQKPHLEGWYGVNVWVLIVDHGLRNIKDLEIVKYLLS